METEILSKTIKTKKGGVKMKKAIIIINESHSMMKEQEKIMGEEFGENWEVYPVPKTGWTLKQMDREVKKIMKTKKMEHSLFVVFVSPIPYMIMELTRRESSDVTVQCFHNDHREKKELPNGKIIQVVAKEGWQLV